MVMAPELYALQETDQALDKAQLRLDEIQAQLVETEEMVVARGAVDDRRVAVEQLRSQLSEAEWSVDEVRTKAADVEKKLYGGSVTNPKELADLDAELRWLKSEMAKREDVLLGLLVDIDDGDAQLASAVARYDELEAEWKQQQDALVREKSDLEPRVATLQAQRDSQTHSLDRGGLRLYEVLRQRHAGQAVARVERGMCQGCRITLPMSVLQKVRSGIGLVQCVSCERILLVN
jgi:predicted  nucleic acid-binding Zn-ribbon protein